MRAKAYREENSVRLSVRRGSADVDEDVILLFCIISKRHMGMDDHHERVGCTHQARPGQATRSRQAYDTPPPSEAELPRGKNERVSLFADPTLASNRKRSGGQRRVP